MASEVPEANLELENNPPRALRGLRPAGADARELPVAEFRKDAGSLSSRALGEALEGLFASSDPATSQDGTSSRTTDTPLCARHVLPLGAGRGGSAAASDPPARILDVSPPQSADDWVVLPAVGALIAADGAFPASV